MATSSFDDEVWRIALPAQTLGTFRPSGSLLPCKSNSDKIDCAICSMGNCRERIVVLRQVLSEVKKQLAVRKRTKNRQWIEHCQVKVKELKHLLATLEDLHES